MAVSGLTTDDITSLLRTSPLGADVEPEVLAVLIAGVVVALSERQPALAPARID